jgi:hypothetical protein
METVQKYTSIGDALRGHTYALFQKGNEYCRVSYYYVCNRKKYQVVFSKESFETATRNALCTNSEKKVLKILNEGFEYIGR